MKAGHGNEVLISANHPSADLSSMTSSFNELPQMGGMAAPPSWNIDDELPNNNTHWRDYHVEMSHNLPKARATKLQPAIRNVLDSSVTPLVKRATSQDLQRARTIVQNALAESSKLNALRLAQPLRNMYGVKPGVSSSSQVGNSTTNKDVTPTAPKSQHKLLRLQPS